jgi:hypothetical protein
MQFSDYKYELYPHRVHRKNNLQSRHQQSHTRRVFTLWRARTSLNIISCSPEIDLAYVAFPPFLIQISDDDMSTHSIFEAKPLWHHNSGLNRIDRIFIPSSYIFFSRIPTAKSSEVKRIWLGAISGYVTDTKVFLVRISKEENVQKRLILICEVSIWS